MEPQPNIVYLLTDEDVLWVLEEWAEDHGVPDITEEMLTQVVQYVKHWLTFDWKEVMYDLITGGVEEGYLSFEEEEEDK